MPTPILLTGDQNEGKTTKLLRIYEELKKLGIPMAGFAAPGIWENNEKTGFNLLNLETNQTILLATVYQQKNYLKYGRFYFNPEAIAFGNQIIKKAINMPYSIIFIDEIGKFELQELIWHTFFQKLIESGSLNVLTVVRKPLLSQIKEKYGLKNTIDYNLETGDKTIINSLLNMQSRKAKEKG